MILITFVVRRLLLSVVVLAIVSVATFLLMQIVPGDPIEAILGDRQAGNPEVRAAYERKFGLDKPVPVQYFYYVKNLLRGDLGISISTRRPVADELGSRIPATVELSLAAMLFALGTGLPLGLIAAIKQHKWPDHLARGIALIGTSVPVFWLGLLFIYLFYYRLGWLPGPGQLDTGMEHPPKVTRLVTLDALLAGQWDVFWSALRHLVMPAVVLGSFAMGIVARMLRSSLVAALSDDYVRTARAKGLVEHRVVIGHAFRNALIPTVTVLGLTFASLLAGAVLTETIFSWPGIGQFAVRTATRLDYPGLLGVTQFVALAYVLFNLLVDVVYGLLDPRIRVS